MKDSPPVIQGTLRAPRFGFVSKPLYRMRKTRNVFTKNYFFKVGGIRTENY